jgi:predicted dehydrogenase
VTDRPRLAVLGAGRIARMFHLRVLADLGAEVVAVADPDPEATAAATDRFPGTATHHDWRDAITRDDVDAVVVCLPSALHGDAARAAFAPATTSTSRSRSGSTSPTPTAPWRRGTTPTASGWWG